MDDKRDHTIPTDHRTGSSGHPNSGSPETIITPLKVTAGAEGTSQSDGRKKAVRTYAAVVAALVILTAGGLWLFSYLSRNPLPADSFRNQNPAAGVRPEASPSTVPIQSPSPGNQAQKTTLDKEEAEQKLADFLKIKKELDSKGVTEWGGDKYRRLQELSQTADAALMQEAFAAAAAGYAQASDAARSIQDSIPDVLQDILDQGRRALREGDGAGAERHFRLALMIEPAHPPALRNLKRVTNCGKVLQLIQSASRHEAGNSLSRARADYEEAVRLDPDSEEAQAGLARVNGLIASRRFDELMAGGITALHENDYRRARKLLLTARSIKPDSPEIGDPLAQADAALKRIRIDELRSEADTAERAEDWSRALAAYQSILSLDGAIQFALQGKDQALKRMELEAGIKNYLAQPSLLETDQSLNRATVLLTEARQMETQGSRLSRLITELDALVAAARTTVTVTIESDGMTEVAVYNVGKLGRFQSRELTLRPGTYTVTGAREGYRDVRHSLSVKPGSAPLSLAVICHEEI